MEKFSLQNFKIELGRYFCSQWAITNNHSHYINGKKKTFESTKFKVITAKMEKNFPHLITYSHKTVQEKL